MRALAAALSLLPLAALADVSADPTRLAPRRLKLAGSFTLAADGAYRVSADARFIAYYSSSRISLFETLTGERVADFEIASKSFHDAALADDGSRFAGLAQDGSIHVWNARTGELLRTFHTGASFSCSAGFAKGGRLLVADDGRRGALVVYDVEAGVETARIPGAGTSYTSVSPDGRFAVVSAGRHRIVDLARQRVVTEDLPSSTRAEISPDSRRVAVASDGMLRVFDLATGVETASAPLPERAWLGCYSPDGRHIVLSDARSQAHFLDARTLRPVHTLKIDEPPEKGRSFLLRATKDGRLVAVSGLDIRVFSHGR